MESRRPAHASYFNFFEIIPSYEGKQSSCTGERSVVIIYNPQKTGILFAKRSKWPQAWSLIAEHIEKGRTPEEEAKKGLIEETTLNLTDIRGFAPIAGAPLVTADTCRRGAKKHTTAIFQCTSLKELVHPNNDEAEELRWISLADLPVFVGRTQDFYHGILSERSFRESPGFIPASIQILLATGLI